MGVYKCVLFFKGFHHNKDIALFTRVRKLVNKQNIDPHFHPTSTNRSIILSVPRKSGYDTKQLRFVAVALPTVDDCEGFY